MKPMSPETHDRGLQSTTLRRQTRASFNVHKPSTLSTVVVLVMRSSLRQILRTEMTSGSMRGGCEYTMAKMLVFTDWFVSQAGSTTMALRKVALNILQRWTAKSFLSRTSEGNVGLLCRLQSLTSSANVRGYGGRLRLEVCTDNHWDWETFLDLCAKGFDDEEAYELPPDPKKRKRLLEEHFHYIYETELSQNRAGLCCLKRSKKNGTNEIIYASCFSYNRSRPTPADKTGMLKVDENEAEECFREEKWLEEAIHEKMRKVAETFDCNRLFGVLHVADRAHRGKGLSKQYARPAMNLLYQDGIRRELLYPKKPTIDYYIIDNVRVRRVQTNGYKKIEIAHLHRVKEVGKNAVCVDDPDSAGEKNFDCIFLFGNVFGGPDPGIAEVKSLFSRV